MSKVQLETAEDLDQKATSYRATESVSSSANHQQAKFPMKAPPGLPFRMLKDLDEEIWLSGSELKTDNSSSEEDEVRVPFGGTKSKLRSKGKKKMKSIRKVMTFSSSSTTSSTLSTTAGSISSTTRSFQRKFLNNRNGFQELQELVSAETTNTNTVPEKSKDTKEEDKLDIEQVPRPDKQWRPKRGSISLLPGLIEQIEIV